jgi:hypothetical protein
MIYLSNNTTTKLTEPTKLHNMINKITRDTANEMGFYFDTLLEDFQEVSVQEHRRGSNFYTRSIVEVNEKWFPELPRELDGFWETNQYVWDDDHGFDKSDIYELYRVEQKERTIVEKYWEKVV